MCMLRKTRLILTHGVPFTLSFLLTIVAVHTAAAHWASPAFRREGATIKLRNQNTQFGFQIQNAVWDYDGTDMSASKVDTLGAHVINYYQQDYGPDFPYARSQPYNVNSQGRITYCAWEDGIVTGYCNTPAVR